MSFFTPAPTPPSTNDPANFNTRADAFLAWMATFATQSENYGAFLAAANMFGVVIPYIFDATTTDADPGAGKLRLGSATQNVSTVIRADLADSLGLDATALIAFMTNSTSTVKGVIRLMKAGDSRSWIYASVSAVAAPSGYRNITISVIAYSSANPFANGDAVILAFVPNGDKGDTGAMANRQPDLVLMEVGTPPTPVGGGSSRVTRVLNTVDRNALGLTVSSPGATLTSGTWTGFALGNAWGVQGTKLFLRNVTDGADLLEGMDAQAIDLGSGYYGFATAQIPWLTFTIAANKVVRLEQTAGQNPGSSGATTFGNGSSGNRNAMLALWKG